MNQILRSPARAFSPVELREVLSSGLMSFPLTDFDKDGDFHEAGLPRPAGVADALRRDGAVRRGRDRRGLLDDAGRAGARHPGRGRDLRLGHADHRRAPATARGSRSRWRRRRRRRARRASS